MYRLLIADDEAHIRTGLETIIEWEIYGIEVAGTSEDGMKAYLAIKELKPDIVLVDISMPNMTGLELIELCSHMDTPPLFIILSGYDNFQYVQRAIQLGAANYLLKPVNQDELINAVISCIERLENRNSQREQFNESIQVLRNDTLNRVLRNKIDSRELREKFQIINVSLHCTSMRTGAVTLLRESENAELPLPELIDICQEICSGLCACYVISDSYENIIIIFKDQLHNIEENRYLQTLAACSDRILSQTGIRSFSALGREVSHSKTLYLSYNDCIAALEKKLIFGDTLDQQVFRDGEPSSSVNYAAFIKYLEEKDTEKIKESLHQYCYDFLSSSHNIELLKYRLVELVSYVFHSKYTSIFSDAEISDKKWAAFTIINETNIISLLEEKITYYFLALIEETPSSADTSAYPFLIQNALAYINDHYADDNLSLKTLAAQMDVNPAYLGREFSLATGEYFNNYLNRIRITKAVQLLSSTTWKTSKIATAVGFTNASYFFTIFKKITGQSPGDYRTSHP